MSLTRDLYEGASNSGRCPKKSADISYVAQSPQSRGPRNQMTKVSAPACRFREAAEQTDSNHCGGDGPNFRYRPQECSHHRPFKGPPMLAQEALRPSPHRFSGLKPLLRALDPALGTHHPSVQSLAERNGGIPGLSVPDFNHSGPRKPGPLYPRLCLFGHRQRGCGIPARVRQSFPPRIAINDDSPILRGVGKGFVGRSLGDSPSKAR